jgi:hypothetical protein
MHNLWQVERCTVFTWGPYFDQADVGVQVKYSSDRNWQSCAIFCKVSGSLFSPGGPILTLLAGGCRSRLKGQELPIMHNLWQVEWIPVFTRGPYFTILSRLAWGCRSGTPAAGPGKMNSALFSPEGLMLTRNP